MPAPAHPLHRQLTLANGLRVSLRHAPRLKRSAAVLRVAAGSHDVPLAWPGLAHFLEHLLFLATERFPTDEGLMAYVQRHGGQVNASTRERTTDFFFELPVSAFADGLERLADMLAQPRLALEDQLREREVLHAEFVAWSQDAKAQQQVALFAGLAADHPLRGFHAGNRDSLPVESQAFQQALREFHQQFYQSGQMTLSLAGPQSLDALETLAQRFSTVLNSSPQRPQLAPPPLMPGDVQGYQHKADNHLHQVITCNAPRAALEFLCTWLNASAPGGLLAELQTRKLATDLQQTGGALALARHDSEDLSEQALTALKTLLVALHLPPAQHTWQLPPNNPFLRPPAKEERAGLIRGQTSAHRGLRTFAQDRSRGRREVSALSFSQAWANDTDEAALYLHWRSAPSDLQGALQPLRENARQAGVELSFETIGNDWLVKMVGLHEPMPAVLDALAHSLNQAQQKPCAPTPTIAIRELLKALPAYCATPPEHRETSWVNARWQGLGLGFPAASEAAIKAAAAHLPGQPAPTEQFLPTLGGQRIWHEVKTDSSEAALLLFCPAPSQSLEDEAAWRLLGHLLQGPFYQRLRVELQIGYAVFSGVRQINGQTGLLFGVQSPNVSREAIVEQLQIFLTQLPTLINNADDMANTALAGQFSASTLPLAQAAELLWHARLAGHPADYLERVQQSIQRLTREDLLHAAEQLNNATGGWRYVANGPRITTG
jgi:secreted Zn-dependent insulinase-like peptidase